MHKSTNLLIIGKEYKVFLADFSYKQKRGLKIVLFYRC